MEDFILNVIKNYYAKFIYFADKSSFIREEVNQLFKITNIEQLDNLIDKSNLLQIDEKDILQNILSTKDYSQENKTSLLNYFQVEEKIINHIELLDNILPFNYINTLVIDKELLKKSDNFYDLRQEIKEIESFLYNYHKNKALENLSIILIKNHQNVGQYHKFKDIITLKTNSLNPSVLYHEFFHLLDNHLAKIYDMQNLFSNENTHKKELTQFNSLISKLDNFIDGNNKENFLEYYEKYLGKNYEKEIKTIDDLVYKIKNIKYLDNDIIIHKQKINNVALLAKELFSHIEYIHNEKEKPKRNLYAIFSEIIDLDLPSGSSYISRTSEKLARIYQSNFKIDKDSLFPLGQEKDFFLKNLLHVINQEIKPLLKNETPLNKIIELREKFNNNIKKGMTNAL